MEETLSMSREHPDVIDSVEKAFTLLEAFSTAGTALTSSDAARLAGLTRPTTRRLLTLVHLGYAEARGRSFELTPRVLRLGYGYLSALPFWERDQANLRELADAVNEAFSAATLDGDEIVYVARFPPRRTMTITLSIGSRLPAYPTSMGRVLLAGLPADRLDSYIANTTLAPLTARTVTDPVRLREILTEVKEQDYAIIDGECEEGVRSAAAPIVDRRRKVIAAVNISARAGPMPLEELRSRWVPHFDRYCRRYLGSAPRLVDKLLLVPLTGAPRQKYATAFVKRTHFISS
jgi:IclR family pca regulon transcriptional regulator